MPPAFRQLPCIARPAKDQIEAGTLYSTTQLRCKFVDSDQSMIRQFGCQSLAQLRQWRCVSYTAICQLAMEGNKSETPTSQPKKSREKQRDEKWFQMYEELKKYKEEHGHCVVPANRKGGSLGIWVNNQRQSYEGLKTINSERFQLLEAIGFDWAVHKEWNDMYEQLKKYKEKHGHCLVPITEGHLGRWVASQRCQYNKTARGVKDPKVLSERFELLTDIGFVWDVRDFRWTRNLEEFKNKFLASKRFPDADEKNDEDIKLKRWIEEQWRGYRSFESWGSADSTTQNRLAMTQNRFDRLTEVGFAEYMLEAHWTYTYEKIKVLLEEDKSWNPPPNNYLYKWTKEQRDAFHDNRLDKDKVERLNKIGFPWEPRTKTQ
ncbi:hypothetical protein ACA910_014325 [Epithemia clementina (nom. ined.)]